MKIPARFDYAQCKQKSLALSERSESRGFTLIELLVAVSIIAILSVIGLTVFSGVQKSARDAKRRADLKAITSALEIYKNQKNSYPATITVCSNNGSDPWIPGLDTNYMTSTPVDPLNSTTGYSYLGTGYSYCYYSGAAGSTTQGTFFMLTTRLENPNSTDLASKCNTPEGTYLSGTTRSSANVYPNNLFVCNQQ